ncbi:MAG: helix-turn-helix transcriptional regulator [Syntrophomonadaceae bacterium]|nr:helix-turn-helix transcriptional regulator [Syntrophomonadaceae bacterium]
MGGENVIGTNLKNICDKRGITMYRISKDTGISQSYLSELVNGKASNPSIEVLIKLSDYLKIPLDSLVK